MIGGIGRSTRGIRRSHARHVRDEGFLDGATEFGSRVHIATDENGRPQAKTTYFWRLR